jgi:biopolymer transport protein ExbD
MPQPTPVMNMTPLIDVLLVLLVIFMAQMMWERSVNIDLPPLAPPPPHKIIDVEHIVLEMTADRHLTINQMPITLENLPSHLRKVYADRRDKTMYIAGAASLRYRDIVELIDAAKGAGVDRVGIVTEGMRRAAVTN